MKRLCIIILAIAVLAGGYWILSSATGLQPKTTEAPIVPIISDNPDSRRTEETPPSPTVLTQNLTIPWDIAFLPISGLLITERPGILVVLDQNYDRQTELAVPGVAAVGEGGLLGVAIHPDFVYNRLVYLYLTTNEGDQLRNQVRRYRLIDHELSEPTTIIDNIPAANNHNGGRLRFGPDGFLYITTGDAGNSSLAPQLNSLAGKVLRLTADGNTPADNPFVSQTGARPEIWSYGHRNPQGLAWDDNGRLWSTEHGRSGLLSGLDELNLIERGGNYGWPDSQGDSVAAGTIGPTAHSGPHQTWAPAGLAHLNNRLFFGGLRGQTLYEVVLNDFAEIVEIREHFSNEFGRLRAVEAGPGGFLYITTGNTDGRGRPQAADDKLIRIDY